MKIYVTGHKGRLGSQLVSIGCDPLDIDITHPDIGIEHDAVIINCAAKTDVDACDVLQDYYNLAIQANVYGPSRLATFYSSNRIFHISTDYVFGGRKGPYSEDFKYEKDTLKKPVAGYAFTKFVGEAMVSLHENVRIIRTTGLYGGSSDRKGFVDLVVSELRTGNEVRVTKELRGNQTYIPHLVSALVVCAERKDIPKVLHIASEEVVSRYEFSLLIASVFGLDKSLLVPVLNEGVPGWIAKRPTKGGLKVALAKKLDLPIYHIKEGLEDLKENV
jgi:dTDP-4-dehydrorhamnose reductase